MCMCGELVHTLSLWHRHPLDVYFHLPFIQRISHSTLELDRVTALCRKLSHTWQHPTQTSPSVYIHSVFGQGISRLPKWSRDTVLCGELLQKWVLNGCLLSFTFQPGNLPSSSAMGPVDGFMKKVVTYMTAPRGSAGWQWNEAGAQFCVGSCHNRICLRARRWSWCMEAVLVSSQQPWKEFLRLYCIIMLLSQKFKPTFNPLHLQPQIFIVRRLGLGPKIISSQNIAPEQNSQCTTIHYRTISLALLLSVPEGSASGRNANM